MIELVDSFVQLINSYLQQFGVPFGILLIIMESILPVLPLGIFIAFNMIAFGSVIGYIISWIATCLGCVLSYLFFSRVVANRFMKKTSKKEKLNKVKKAVKNISFSKLVLIVALPFTPAFLVNIACGITKVKYKKFLAAILIGKLSIVYFWGFVGKSLLQSITDINTIIIVIVLLLVSYILSKIVNKRFGIE